ncbi:plasminogen activator inhibitor 1 RNA-binding protein [Trichonephila inaurata madagascariensis]|uniref:Plasminogen activator inhibitor 1 RNA-binding protein n=1 Tax=Trichonephila inaurata madagascariensis TaxID=2747483 RepID=A0A8X7CJQ7_9ARAC|nr:plasminogen activator inhibitor 1 RNA-binding protein [Trichonephila inaurata madagascariensis]
MDVTHGIGVTNRFDIFCNEEDVDPYELLRKQEEEKEKRKLEKTQMKDKMKTAKPNKAIVTTASPKKPTENSTAKSAKAAGEVPNKPRGFKTDRPPRNAGTYQDKETEKNSRNNDFFNPDQRDGEYRRGRGGYRGRGGRDRGRGFFPNAEGRPRRVFDRHSGSDKTGVKPVDKRGGAGPGNWGDIRSELNQSSSETAWDEEFEGGDRPRESANWGNEEFNESGKFGDDAQKGGGEIPAENPESKENEHAQEQIQEAVKEMTLDEYKKILEAQKTVYKFNIRKPGEGEDPKQWKKGYVLKKKVPIEDEEEEEDDDDDEIEECGSKGQKKVLLDIQINFSDSRRGMRGRGRGGRNSSRGGPGRDGGNRDFARDDRYRGGRGREAAKKIGQQAPRVDDFNDFPSLNNA